jgi:hypothetical protein
MSRWTTKLVRHCISTRLAVEDGQERVRQGRYALGLRLRRLRHRHLKAHPQEHAACVRTLHEHLQAWSAEQEWLFVDEATVRRHPPLTAQWCLAEAVPEVVTGDDPTKMQVYGAVAPLTGQTHYRLGRCLGKTGFATFLR